jgi:hypothetical protein
MNCLAFIPPFFVHINFIGLWSQLCNSLLSSPAPLHISTLFLRLHRRMLGFHFSHFQTEFDIDLSLLLCSDGLSPSDQTLASNTSGRIAFAGPLTAEICHGKLHCSFVLQQCYAQASFLYPSRCHPSCCQTRPRDFDGYSTYISDPLSFHMQIVHLLSFFLSYLLTLRPSF